MKSGTNRRRFTVEQKVAILRRHLVDKVAVSDLCDEYKIQPSLFYQWQRQVMENLDASLESGPGRKGAGGDRRRELEKRIAAVEARLAKKDEVIAEISAEYIALKKELGEL
jgi:transposase-like protein